MKEKLLARYKFLEYNDITVIPHGFDEEDFPQTMAHIAAQSHSDANAKPKKDKSKKFVITHCGLFPDSRTPKYFLKGAAIFLRKNPAARQHLQLLFVGIMRPQHIRLLKRYNLRDITTLTGYLPHSEAVQYLQNSDMN